MRKIAFFILICLSLTIIPTTKIDCCYASNLVSGICVLEKDSGRIISEKNKDLKLPMASTTKVVTCITVIQNCSNLDEKIVVDDSAVGVEGSSIYLKKGEQISVRDLLYGLMLRSGNDSAVALAVAVSGSIKDFATKMNEVAKNAGATNSNFVNPHGLHDDNHYTTAYDLALITAYALNNPIFKDIVSTKNHIIEETNVSEKRYLTNKNKLLSSLDGCCGVKTGYTKKAGRCLVSACARDETTYVCVVLNCGPMFEKSAELLNFCFNNYNNELIIDKNKQISNEYVIDDKYGRLYLYTNEDFKYPLLDEEKDDIKIKYYVNLNDAEVGDEVGTIQVFLDNRLLKSLKLYTMNKIDKLIDSKTLTMGEILWEEKANEN